MWEFIGKWGTPGSQAGEFNGPSGLAFDAEENLWVVDSLNHRVQTYTKDGKFLNQWGTHGSGQGELNMPWGITIDEKGDVFVADWKNHRVQKFTTSGTFLAQIGWPAPKAGELGHPEYDSYPHDENWCVSPNTNLSAWNHSWSKLTKYSGVPLYSVLL